MDRKYLLGSKSRVIGPRRFAYSRNDILKPYHDGWFTSRPRSITSTSVCRVQKSEIGLAILSVCQSPKALRPASVSRLEIQEPTAHRFSYVCMIEEFGGRPVRAGQYFSAALGNFGQSALPI